VSSFLFVVPPFAGHVNPTLGVADELSRRGHEVGHLVGEPLPVTRPAELRGFAAMKFLWDQVLLPLAETMVPAVERAVDERRPDVLVVDQQAFAGAVVAERRGLPWATFATTSGELVPALPNVRRWQQDRLGVPFDPRFSPHLIIACTTPALAGEVAGNVCFAGPILRPRAVDVAFPWEWLDPLRPLVLITLGTVNADARFLRECVTAIGDRPWLQAVIADPARALDDVPVNVLVRPVIPQLELLDWADATLCHAGHNTVCESLSAGVPLVVAPIRDDQPVIAEQVVRAGAGLRLRFNHATAWHIGQAIDDVLNTSGYRDAAYRVRESFQAAGGASLAADRLQTLVTKPFEKYAPADKKSAAS
jgi:UDP:flavonoid glycosyltransferase YjiC (YdhE family)